MQELEQDLYVEQLMHAARTDPAAHDLYLQEFIRATVPDPSAGSGRVPPLRDDEIGQFYCKICMQTKLVYDRFRGVECAHEFCVGCIVKFIELRFAERAVPVRCPEPGCRDGVPHPEACWRLLDLDVFEAWCLALSERALGPGRARCPYLNCGVLMVIEGKDARDVPGAVAQERCPSCLRGFCLLCEEPWHHGHGAGAGAAGEGCALARLAEERLWRRCPSCRAIIDKIEGCKLMLCRCGCVFCFVCGSLRSLCTCTTINLAS